MLLLWAAVAVALSGVPGLFLDRRRGLGQVIAMAMNVGASLMGAAAVILYLTGGLAAEPVAFAWTLPWGGFVAGMDATTALFLMPMLLISALGSIYGMSYWKQAEHPGDGRKLRLCWGLLTAALMLIVLARDGALFLIAWEIMALAAFFLVDTEDQKPEVRRAAWVYLVATHVGTLGLFGLFALLKYGTHSFALWPVGLEPGLANAVFVLGVLGFGLKAGIMPLHVWLPGAHATAPSHVSAMLSGVMLNVGIYGLVRITGALEHPPLWWGGTLLILGGISGVAGIAFAMAQKDFKRLLAYSSIENIGIVVMGIGLALIGRTVGRADLVELGMAGALLHMVNHSLFKPLLFWGAGSLLHAVHTRQMDVLGGLGKLMPRTFMLCAIGAVAICGLPPLNGFVSELLLYIGFFRSVHVEGRAFVWAGLAAPVLAMIGGLALSGFVKLLGMVFGGMPRTEVCAHAHDPQPTMWIPMAILAGLCVALGTCPAMVAGLIEAAVADWSPAGGARLADLVPLGGVGLSAAGLAGAVVLVWGLLKIFKGRKVPASAGTWDCGYVRPTRTMQYTGTSFSQLLAEVFSWVLWPRRLLPNLRALFPGRTNFSSEVPDPVLDRALVPGLGFAERLSALARPIQRGIVQMYLLYVLLALVVLLIVAFFQG